VRSEKDSPQLGHADQPSLDVRLYLAQAKRTALIHQRPRVQGRKYGLVHRSVRRFDREVRQVGGAEPREGGHD